MKEHLLRKIHELYHIPVYVYGENTNLLRIPENLPLIPMIEGKLELIEQMVKKNQAPILFLEEGTWYWAGMQDEEAHQILFGPISKKPVWQGALIAYKHRHQLEAEITSVYLDMKQVKQILTLLELEVNNHDISEDRIRIASVVESIAEWNVDAEKEYYELEQSEWERDHNSTEYEEKLLEIVRSGDLSEAEKMVYGGVGLGEEHIGVVAGKELKQAEYLCVVLITIVCRAAVQGGMNQEHAYSMADLYMQRLEKCRNTSEMYAIASRAQYEYTYGVWEAKKAKTEVCYIEQCKAYIAKNLRKPMKVGDIAPAIGINRSYLARRFSQVEGITIQNYIMRERCIHAANMLKYSNYPIAIIAEYFCFSSQSHFGKCFQDVYGLTPKTYRNKHQRKVQEI